MSYDSQEHSQPERPAAPRVTVPAIFLIVVGVLNLLGSLAAFGAGYVYSQVSPAEVEKLIDANPKNKARVEDWKREGHTVEELLNMFVKGAVITGIVTLTAALLVILGGICMLSLKAYPLAIIAALLAAIPWVSPTGCCGLGEGIGIWALVVLLSADVRAAFGRGSPPAADTFEESI